MIFFTMRWNKSYVHCYLLILTDFLHVSLILTMFSLLYFSLPRRDVSRKDGYPGMKGLLHLQFPPLKSLQITH